MIITKRTQGRPGQTIQNASVGKAKITQVPVSYRGFPALSACAVVKYRPSNDRQQHIHTRPAWVDQPRNFHHSQIPRWPFHPSEDIAGPITQECLIYMGSPPYTYNFPPPPHASGYRGRHRRTPRYRLIGGLCHGEIRVSMLIWVFVGFYPESKGREQASEPRGYIQITRKGLRI